MNEPDPADSWTGYMY